MGIDSGGIGALLSGFTQAYGAGQDRKRQREQMEMQQKLINAQIKTQDIKTQMEQSQLRAVLDMFSRGMGNQTATPNVTGQETSAPGDNQSLIQMISGGQNPTAASPKVNIPMAPSPAVTGQAQAGNNPKFSDFLETPEGQIVSHKLFGFVPKFDSPERQAAKTMAVETAKNTAEKNKNLPKVRDTYLGLNRQWDLVDKTINEAIDSIGPFTAGAGSFAKNIPGTPQKTLDQRLTTIKANIGFDRLQQMRNDSPTGGALGQVSDKENALLQAVQGSLDQALSPEELKANLLFIKNNLAQVRADKANSFKADYGFVPAIGSTKPSLTPGKKKKSLSDFEGQ